MTAPLRARSRFASAILAASLLAAWPAAAQVGLEPTAGAAANWALGRQLLADGDVTSAVAYLHAAYRAEPDEPAIALDFQEALAADGYVKDAVDVLDRLISAAPDSLDWRLRRSSLLLRLNRPKDALADLQEVRRRGGTTPPLVSAEAQVLAGMGRADEALDVFRDGIEQFPAEGPRFYLGMADVLQQAGEPKRIAPLMEQGIAAHPRDPGLRLVQIRALAAVGDDAGALAAARRADAELPVDAASAEPVFDPETEAMVDDGGSMLTMPFPEDGFQVELADFYARHNRPALAVGVLQPMSERGELPLGPSLWLARLLLGTDQAEQGQALVADINSRWPESARGWHLRARVAEDRRDWSAALGFHRKAVALDERDPELRLGLVRAMLVNWEKDVAMADPTPEALARKNELREQAIIAVTLIPDADTQGHLVLGYALHAVGELERAADHFEMAAEDKDLRRTARVQQSICLDEAGQPGRAKRALEILRREFPDDPEVANSLGYFLAEKGEDLERADALVAQALKDQPANGAFLDSMGWVRYRQGRAEDALDYLIRAVNVLPNDPVILEHLGMVLQAVGQPVEAGNAFRRALEAGGDPGRLNAAVAAADSAAAAARP